jgi:hypothetical protein
MFIWLIIAHPLLTYLIFFPVPVYLLYLISKHAYKFLRKGSHGNPPLRCGECGQGPAGFPEETSLSAGPAQGRLE